MAGNKSDEPVPTLSYARREPPPPRRALRTTLNPKVPNEIVLGIVLVEIVALAWRHPAMCAVMILLVAEFVAFYVIRPWRSRVRALLIDGVTILVIGLLVLCFRLSRVDEGPRPTSIVYWLTENQTYQFNVGWATRYVLVCYAGVAWIAAVGAYAIVRRLVVGRPGRNNLPSHNRSEKSDG